MNKDIVTYEGTAIFEDHNWKYGLMDRNNYILTDEYWFDNIYSFKKFGLAEFEKWNFVWVINYKWKIIIDECQDVFFNKSYPSIITFQKNNQFGIVDKAGNIKTIRDELIGEFNSSWYGNIIIWGRDLDIDVEWKLYLWGSEVTIDDNWNIIL